MREGSFFETTIIERASTWLRCTNVDTVQRIVVEVNSLWCLGVFNQKEV